jgi:hypothetical protein
MMFLVQVSEANFHFSDDPHCNIKCENMGALCITFLSAFLSLVCSLLARRLNLQYAGFSAVRCVVVAIRYGTSSTIAV